MSNSGDRGNEARADSAFSEGYQIGFDEGWARGKEQAWQEIRSRLRGVPHAPDCQCSPCLIISEVRSWPVHGDGV